MEFKGTKGEWKFIRNEESFHIETFGTHSWLIAKTITNDEQDLSNAKLISCAPEMLEMLKDVLDCNNRGFYEHINFNEIEELIKKATTI